MKRPLRTTHNEVSPTASIDLHSGGPNCGGCSFVLKNGQHIVYQVVIVAGCTPRKCTHLLRFSQNSDDQINDVTSQFKHDPAGVLSQFAAACGINNFAHHGVNFKDVSQPALLQEFSQQNDSGVIAIHVSHLQKELLLRGRVQNLCKLRKGFSGRLINMYMLTSSDADFCNIQQLADFRFDKHSLQPRDVQKLFLSHPRQIFVRILR